MRAGNNTVSVKYCGGCNPRINRESLAAALAGAGARLVYPEKSCGRPEADFLLIINGCETGCVSPEDHAGYRHHTVVRGRLVDDSYCPEEQLPDRVIAAWLKARGPQE